MIPGALPGFGFLCSEKVDMGSVGTERFEECSFPDAATTVDDLEVVTWRLERCLQRVEFVVPVVDGHSLDNDYYDNDLQVPAV